MGKFGFQFMLLGQSYGVIETLCRRVKLDCFLDLDIYKFNHLIPAYYSRNDERYDRQQMNSLCVVPIRWLFRFDQSSNVL